MSLTPNRNVINTAWADRDRYVTKNSTGAIEGTPVYNENLTLRQINRDYFELDSANTPGFKRIKGKSHLLPNNLHLRYKLISSSPKSSVFEHSDDGTYTAHVTIRETIGISSDLSLGAAATAEDPTQRVISKLMDSVGTAKADLATTMLEMGKTAQMVASTATRIAGAISGLKRGRLDVFCSSIGVSYTTRDILIYRHRFRKATLADSRTETYKKMSVARSNSRVTDLVADTWLEYSYGWKPLLKDVFDIAQATASTMIDRQYVVRYQTEKSRTEKSTTEVADTISLHTESKKRSVRYCAIGLNYMIPNGAISVSNAFGLTNPLNVAWEMLPFSFVVDWFLPVGTAIKGLTAFDGLAFHSGWKSTRHVWSVESSATLKSFVAAGGVIKTRGGTVGGNASGVEITREPLYTFPRYGFPRFKDPRSFAHAASAIALLQSIFLRK